MKTARIPALFAASVWLLSPTAALLAQGAASSPETGGDSGFEYTIPDEAAGLAMLTTQLEAEQAQARAAFDEQVAEQERMRAEYPDAHSYETIYDQSWAVAGDHGRLLSLGSTIYRYDGGAHGNTAYDAKLWDREEDHGVDMPFIFTDRYAAYSIIDRGYCERIGAMREERGLEQNDDDIFTRCPLLHEQTLVPGGEDGAPMTYIDVLVPPYVAGPYAAGPFEVRVPVTDALLDLLRPEYRDAFAAGE